MEPIKIDPQVIVKMLEEIGQEKLTRGHWADPASEGHVLVLANASRIGTLLALIKRADIQGRACRLILVAGVHASRRVSVQLKDVGAGELIQKQCRDLTTAQRPKQAKEDPNAELRGEMCC